MGLLANLNNGRPRRGCARREEEEEGDTSGRIKTKKKVRELL